MNKLSIITVNYNSWSFTKGFLDSLSNYKRKDWEVIVVDNASEKNEIEYLENIYPWVKFVRSNNNLGFSGGNNLGVLHSSGEYLFFINNDVIIKEDCFSLLLEDMEENSSIGAISPKIINKDGSYNYLGCDSLDKYLMRIHYRTNILGENSKVKEKTSLVHGAAVLIRRTALSVVGGWPEMYFLYSEEIDLSLHLKKAGYELLYEPNVELLHIGSCSTGKNSPLVCYYNSRNRLLLYRRNLEAWKRYYAILYHILLTVPHNSLKYIKEKQYDLLFAYLSGVKDFILSRFGKRK